MPEIWDNKTILSELDSALLAKSLDQEIANFLSGLEYMKYTPLTKDTLDRITLYVEENIDLMLRGAGCHVIADVIKAKHLCSVSAKMEEIKVDFPNDSQLKIASLSLHMHKEPDSCIRDIEREIHKYYEVLALLERDF